MMTVRNERDGLRRGFTLVEMVVTIGIIVVLAALTLTGIAVMSEQSEVKTTRNTMKLLDIALQEWERRTRNGSCRGVRTGNHPAQRISTKSRWALRMYSLQRKSWA